MKVDIEAIRKRWANVGPWESGYNPGAEAFSSNELVVRPAGQFPHGTWIADVGRFGDDDARDNAERIAHAPTDVQNLLRVIDRQAEGVTLTVSVKRDDLGTTNLQEIAEQLVERLRRAGVYGS